MESGDKRFSKVTCLGKFLGNYEEDVKVERLDGNSCSAPRQQGEFYSSVASRCGFKPLCNMLERISIGICKKCGLKCCEETPPSPRQRATHHEPSIQQPEKW